jgi:hypothetical protein
MFNKTTEIQMLTEISRLITPAMNLANILWYSGAYAHRFNLQTGKKMFYLRYRALANSRGFGAADTARHEPARFSRNDIYSL